VKRFAAGLFLISLASASAAQGIAEGKWWRRPRIAQELQLSRDQAAELEKIFARSKPKLIDLRADLEKKQFDYDQAMLDEKADRKAIESKIEVREQARAALQKELSLMELDMKQVLKPDQRERLMRLRENARLRMQERRRRLREDNADEEGVDVRKPPRARPSPQPNR
jgi:Spy/CpxP family protein refolding chaperone